MGLYGHFSDEEGEAYLKTNVLQLPDITKIRHWLFRMEPYMSDRGTYQVACIFHHLLCALRFIEIHSNKLFATILAFKSNQRKQLQGKKVGSTSLK